MLDQNVGLKFWVGGLLVVAVALCWPLHLFPMPNFIEELFVGLAVLALLVGLLWATPRLRLTPWLAVWLVYGFLLVLNNAWHPASFVSGKVGYLLFWGVGFAALLIGCQVSWSDDAPALKLARILAGLAVLSAIMGVLRHYNLLWSGLGWLIPDVPSTRMLGLVGHANFFAYVSLLGVFALAWLFEARRIDISWLLLLGLLLIYSIVCSGGRSVVLAWGAAAVMVLLTVRITAAWRFLAVMVLGLLAYITLRPLMGEVDVLLSRYWGGSRLDPALFDMAGRGLDSSGRVQEWRLAWQLFVENWFMGVGAGNYAGAAFAKHVALGLASPPGLFLHSHNSILQFLVEFGLLGLLWLLLVLGLVARNIRFALLRRERLLPLAVLLALFVYGCFEFPLWMMHFFVLNLLLLEALGKSGWVFELRLGRAIAGVLAFVVVALSVVYVPYVERFYWSFKQYIVREKVETVEYQFINAMSRDPLLEPYAYFIYLANFDISPSTLDFEVSVLERLRSFRPNHQVLIRLAIVYALQGDVGKARKVVADMRTYYGRGYDEQLRDEIGIALKGFPGKDVYFLLK